MNKVDNFLKYSAMSEVFSEVLETESDGGYERLMYDTEATTKKLRLSEDYQDWWDENVRERVADIYWSLKHMIKRVREMEVQIS
jgi:hypothetical protein